MGRHRLVNAGHVGALLGLTMKRAGDVLTRLAGGGYVERQTVFDQQPACYRIKPKGLAVIGSHLPPPGVDLRSYEHDVGVAWLWLAAHDGIFGPPHEVFAERELRSHDEAPDRVDPPLAVKLGGFGPGGRERLHYPDLVVDRQDGRRVAVELELTSKGRTRLEGILAGYGADPRIDTVLYLVPNRTIGKAVLAAAERVGIAGLVQVQFVRDESRAEPRAAGRALERAHGSALGRAPQAPDRRTERAL